MFCVERNDAADWTFMSCEMDLDTFRLSSYPTRVATAVCGLDDNASLELYFIGYRIRLS